MAMRPEIGELGKYWSSDCSLRVEIVSYEEFEEEFHTVRRVGLKILKNIDANSKLEYPEGNIITYESKNGESEDNLEGLILDSGMRI